RNLIFASPYKSRIKVLQSIGRGLRMAESKTKCTVFDIADDFNSKKGNITLKHFNERVKLYYEEDFEPQIYRIDLK
ncbi:MAG TPA: UvsW, partial [Methylomirabilota bacterium]|nr:UvsW [Methylomirabilota bacterium]